MDEIFGKEWIKEQWDFYRKQDEKLSVIDFCYICISKVKQSYKKNERNKI